MLISLKGGHPTKTFIYCNGISFEQKLCWKGRLRNFLFFILFLKGLQLSHHLRSACVQRSRSQQHNLHVSNSNIISEFWLHFLVSNIFISATRKSRKVFPQDLDQSHTTQKYGSLTLKTQSATLGLIGFHWSSTPMTPPAPPIPACWCSEVPVLRDPNLQRIWRGWYIKNSQGGGGFSTLLCFMIEKERLSYGLTTHRSWKCGANMI